MNIVERQGIVAALLTVMIIQQWGLQKKLLEKICTLEEFIMECYKNEMIKDNPTGTWVKK
jgi:hypothetical protein